ncbi:MAG: hypothetical protein Ct9H300mP12_08920 [Acidimicrobiales bacterium]|nr:MAG: hypothetical protein Ct9H300mP12_08920 [Acidimicrobiales bacterium]
MDVNSLEHVSATELALNDIARCTITADAVAIDPYATNRRTGLRPCGSDGQCDGSRGNDSGRLLDLGPEPFCRPSPPPFRDHAGGASGTFRPAALHGPTDRFDSGGKSTIAAGLERRLFDRGHATIRLDGENVRLGISRDLGFSARDRSENLRR